MANFCRNCGGKVEEKDKFCAQCGARLDNEPQKEEKWNKYDWEKEEWEEKPQQAAEEKKIDWKKHILVGLLLAIPFVNLGVCVALLMNKNLNPNHRRLVKIWLILNIIGLLLGALLAYGVVQLMFFDHQVDLNHHIQYSVPQMQFMEEFLIEL